MPTALLAEPNGLTDPARLAALAATGLSTSEPDEAFDRLTRLVQSCLGVPIALVSFVEGDRQVFKSAQGLPPSMCSTPLSHSLCQHVVARDAPLAVEDARQDPLVQDNLAISDLGVIAYLGVPLKSPDGHTLGSLCAIEGQPRAWTGRDLEILEALAQAAMAEIGARWRQSAEADDLWRAVEQGRALVRALFEGDRPRAILHRGRIADANGALLGLLGRDRASVVGQMLRDVLHLRPDGATTLADALVNADLGDRLQIRLDTGIGDVEMGLAGVPVARAVIVEVAEA